MSSITEEKGRLVLLLGQLDPTSEEYENIVNMLLKLDQVDKKPDMIKTIVNGAINLIGLLTILNYERTDVLTSKATMFIRRN